MVGQNFFTSPPLLVLLLDPGSTIRDPGWIKIRIKVKHPGSETLAYCIRVVPLMYYKVLEIRAQSRITYREKSAPGQEYERKPRVIKLNSYISLTTNRCCCRQSHSICDQCDEGWLRCCCVLY
jgi:hypothetical protein